MGMFFDTIMDVDYLHLPIYQSNIGFDTPHSSSFLCLQITFLTDDEAYRVLKQEFGEQCLPRKYGGRSEFQLAQDYRLETPVRVFS